MSLKIPWNKKYFYNYIGDIFLKIVSEKGDFLKQIAISVK